MVKAENIMNFIKGDKKRFLFIVIAVFGVLLILLSLGGGEESSAAEDSLAEYEKRLEKELSELCSAVEGAGRCRVNVTFSDGERTEYRGTSKVSTTPPRVLGITVIAEGGGKPEVKSALTECMTAMFNIKANRVAVLKMR